MTAEPLVATRSGNDSRLWRYLRAPVVFVAWLFAAAAGHAASRPNLVFIFAHDLGNGDVRAVNPNGKIPTPSLDRLAD